MSLAQETRDLFPGCPFRPPASQESILEAERELGESLPAPLRELYLAFDGFYGPTNASYLWPLSGEDGLVSFNLLLRSGEEFPRALMAASIFFGEDGVGTMWGFKRDLPNKIIQWAGEWEDEEIVGDTVLDAWKQAKRRYEQIRHEHLR